MTIMHYRSSGDIDFGYGEVAFVAWEVDDYGQNLLLDVLQGPQPPEELSYHDDYDS